jgi:hypothetical protein
MGKNRLSQNKAYYKRLFMKQAGVKTRSGKAVYINKEYYERIMRIIQTIGANEISLFDYLNNVLAQHFATYKDEISTLS